MNNEEFFIDFKKIERNSKNQYFFSQSFGEYMSSKASVGKNYVNILLARKGKATKSIRELLVNFKEPFVSVGLKNTINPILAYFLSCIISKKNVPISFDTYKDFLISGANISENELKYFESFLKYCKAFKMKDFEILVSFLSLLYLAKKYNLSLEFCLDEAKIKELSAFFVSRLKNDNQRIFYALREEKATEYINDYIIKIKGDF